MMMGGIWGLFNGEPIIPYIYNSFTQSSQDMFQIITKGIGIVLIIGGIILFYYINKLPSDKVANSIANHAETIKKSIIDLNQLYNSIIDKAMAYDTNDYLPFIENDIIFQNDLKKYLDKGVAIRSYVAYNPENPVLQNLKRESKDWNFLNDSITRSAISISDKKLFTLLRSYKSQLDLYGLYKLKTKITLNENPVANYTYRQIVNLNQGVGDINTENARTNLIDHLNELISEYAEESNE